MSLGLHISPSLAPQGKHTGPSQPLHPTPALTEYSSGHQAADMAEIDARLKALQEYMNQLDTRS